MLHIQFFCIFLKCVCVCVFVCSQSSLTLCDPMLYSARLLSPWNSPGKNTGASFHLLLPSSVPTQRCKLRVLSFLNWQVDCLPPALLGKSFVSLYLNPKSNLHHYLLLEAQSLVFPQHLAYTYLFTCYQEDHPRVYLVTLLL